ncbi:hypothetical protein Droror1_Dr00013444 [Drosera rotundifolia]
MAPPKSKKVVVIVKLALETGRAAPTLSSKGVNIMPGLLINPGLLSPSRSRSMIGVNSSELFRGVAAVLFRGIIPLNYSEEWLLFFSEDSIPLNFSEEWLFDFVRFDSKELTQLIPISEE